MKKGDTVLYTMLALGREQEELEAFPATVQRVYDDGTAALEVSTPWGHRFIDPADPGEPGQKDTFHTGSDDSVAKSHASVEAERKAAEADKGSKTKPAPAEAPAPAAEPSEAQ